MDLRINIKYEKKHEYIPPRWNFGVNSEHFWRNTKITDWLRLSVIAGQYCGVLRRSKNQDKNKDSWLFGSDCVGFRRNWEV